MNLARLRRLWSLRGTPRCRLTRRPPTSAVGAPAFRVPSGTPGHSVAACWPPERKDAGSRSRGAATTSGSARRRCESKRDSASSDLRAFRRVVSAFPSSTTSLVIRCIRIAETQFSIRKTVKRSPLIMYTKAILELRHQPLRRHQTQIQRMQRPLEATSGTNPDQLRGNRKLFRTFHTSTRCWELQRNSSGG